MATQENHTGSEGVVTADGVDRKVDNWNITTTTNVQPVTTTDDYDAASDATYERVLKTTRRAEGEFSFPYDSNNEPYPAVEDGKTVALVLARTRTGKNFSFPEAIILTTRFEQGGIEGIMKVTCTFRNNGIFQIT